MARRIVLQDSCKMIPSSLSGLIDDHNKVMLQTKSPPSDFFPVTKSFAIEAGFSQEQFLALTSTKVKMPFQLCTNITSMANCKNIPPKEAFKDKLSNTDESIKDEDYQSFIRMWTLFKCHSLIDILWIYSLAGTNPLLHSSFLPLSSSLFFFPSPITLFTRDKATLYEGVSVRPPIGPSVHRSVRNQFFLGLLERLMPCIQPCF